VASGPSAGAEIMTFFTGARRCFFCVRPFGEEASGFDDDIRADGSPIDFGGIFYLENLEALAIHGDRVFGVGDFVRQVAEDRVVFQEVREGLRVRDVVDGDELNVLVVERGAHDVASDAAEAVDAYLNGHSSSDGCDRNCGCAGAGDGRG